MLNFASGEFNNFGCFLLCTCWFVFEFWILYCGVCWSFTGERGGNPKRGGGGLKDWWGARTPSSSPLKVPPSRSLLLISSPPPATQYEFHSYFEIC